MEKQSRQNFASKAIRLIAVSAVVALLVAAMAGCSSGKPSGVANCAANAANATANTNANAANNANTNAANKNDSSKNNAAAAAKAAEFQKRLDEIKSNKAADKRFGGSTMDMIEASNVVITAFDDLMTDIVAFLKTDCGMKDIEGQQSTWEQGMWERIDAGSASSVGGSLYAIARGGIRMDEQESRIVELIALVADATPSSSSNSGSSANAGGSKPAAPSSNGGSNGGSNGSSNATSDLNKAEVNLFLSNFTEDFASFQNGYSQGAWDTQKYVWWAFEHDFINSRSRIERRTDSWPAQTKADQFTYGEWRISDENVRNLVKTWFKVDIDPSKTTGPHIDNYSYFYVGGGMLPYGVAHSTSITAKGDNRYQVAFDVYAPDNHAYDNQDESLYSMSASKLKSTFGVSGPFASGTAVIEAGYDGIAPFKLIEFSVSR